MRIDHTIYGHGPETKPIDNKKWSRLPAAFYTLVMRDEGFRSAEIHPSNRLEDSRFRPSEIVVMAIDVNARRMPSLVNNQ
ncbi:hypothetical protein GCM10010924_35210 [Rhizobium wenxiniae]|jgi:hypothetical protein|nr:hypothetical protein GCM10010924_35210 [Rhizobium wenxiniae]